MSTVSLARSDLFPVGTTVSVYAGSSIPHSGGVPAGTAVASAVVDAAGNLLVDNAAILPYTSYIAHATVSGQQRYALVRSTLDRFDNGSGTGTGDTTNNSATVPKLSIK